MRTSLIELQQIEEYIFNTDNNQLPGKTLALNSEMAEKVQLQKDAYALILQYGRRKLKTELETIHQKLFTETRYTRFRRHVMLLFC